MGIIRIALEVSHKRCLSPSSRGLRYIAGSILLIFTFWLILFLAPPPPLRVTQSCSKALFDSRGALLSLSLCPDERYRMDVPLSKISPALIRATTLYEDKHYFYHPGINPVSLFRAAIATALSPRRPIGASTLTMQLARINLGLNTRTISGKLKQMFWALVMERHYSKAEILEAYFNEAPYGANIEGIAAASLIYFRKLPADLTTPEAITLAVLPQNPALRWREAGKADLDSARAVLLAKYGAKSGHEIVPKDFLFTPAQVPAEAPHYFSRLEKLWPDKTALASTIEPDLQHDAEEVLKTTLASFSDYGVRNGTVMIAELPEMKVRAYVGSAGYVNSSISGYVNGLAAKRSPGSLLKPFLYALAIDQGEIIPETMLRDMPIRLSSYTPENFERNFLGPISATDALVRSRNIPALELFRTVQPGSFYNLLESAGVKDLKSEDYYGIALVLGGLGTTPEEIAQLYGVLGNGGKFKPLQYLADEIPPSSDKQLFSPEAAFLALDMLSKNPPALGQFKQQRIPWKTGTSYGSRDAWAAGLFGKYVVVVWLGEFDGKPNPNLVGRDLAGPVFFSVVDRLRVRGIIPGVRSPRGLNLKQVEVCALSGELPGPDCPHTKMSWFIPGVSPIHHCEIHRKVAVDPGTGLRLCPGEQGGEGRVFEFWESGMQKLFVRAGLRRATPPPYEARCGMPSSTDSKAEELRIVTPEEHIEYRLEPHRGLELELLASAPADAKELFWFVGDTLIQRTEPTHSVHWNAQVGKFLVRVVDDRGRSSTVSVRVLPQDGGETG